MGFDPEKIRGTNVVAVVDVHQVPLVEDDDGRAARDADTFG